MIPFLDHDLQPLKIGDHVEVKHCVGRYGETRTVTGTLTTLDQSGGIAITLDPGRIIIECSKFGTTRYQGGDRYYIANAFTYDSTLKARVGKGEHKDFEHGHTYHCKKLCNS